MIGALRHVIILQRQSETADAGGGTSSIWSDIAEVRAEVIPLTGSETVQAMRVQPVQNYLIRMRYRGDVTTADRLLFGQRILNIRSVKNVNERGRWMECRCEEGVAS